MSMRIRQVKADFWRDSIVGKLDDACRLVYIGLWMEADDAGWLVLDVVAISADLYPYTPATTRERRVQKAIDTLVERGRVIAYPCGHAFIPRLTTHQRLAGPDKRVYTVERAHKGCGIQAVGTGAEGATRGDPRGPAEPRFSPTRNGKGTSYGKEGEGQGGYGGDGSAVTADQDRETGASEFQRLVPRPTPVGVH